LSLAKGTIMEKLNLILSINPNYIIIALLVIFYTLEQVTNTPFKFNKRPQHLLQNFQLFVLFFAANFFFATFQVFCIEWLNNQHVGLFYLFHVPFWIKLIVGVAFYDVTAYWIHRSTHKVPLLWRFHRVHHSDTKVDSSSFFRFHPIELILVFGMGNILTAAIFGTDVLSMVLYYFILNIFLFFEHSNLKYPTWLDRTLGWIFVTPNMHKVHHDQDQDYTDSNFADILILWDRLFGTYKYKPVINIRYGLMEFDEDKKQTSWYLLKSPFINFKRINSDELTSIKKTETNNIPISDIKE